jgi:hypothetical protein
MMLLAALAFLLPFALTQLFAEPLQLELVQRP